MSKKKPSSKINEHRQAQRQALQPAQERVKCFYLSPAERLMVNAPTLLHRYPRDPLISLLFAMECGHRIGFDGVLDFREM